MDYKVYCDMDGVLTDFKEACFITTGIKLTEHTDLDQSAWDEIEEAGLEFWENMSWEKDGKELWSYIKKHKPVILSSPAKFDESRIGKMNWVERELKHDRVVLRSSKKKKDLATPESVLIDDRVDNIAGWKEEGGIGILHKNTKETIKQLKKLNL